MIIQELIELLDTIPDEEWNFVQCNSRYKAGDVLHHYFKKHGFETWNLELACHWVNEHIQDDKIKAALGYRFDPDIMYPMPLQYVPHVLGALSQ